MDRNAGHNSCTRYLQSTRKNGSTRPFETDESARLTVVSIDCRDAAGSSASEHDPSKEPTTTRSNSSPDFLFAKSFQINSTPVGVSRQFLFGNLTDDESRPFACPAYKARLFIWAPADSERHNMSNAARVTADIGILHVEIRNADHYSSGRQEKREKPQIERI
jgi:hypothetical protein